MKILRNNTKWLTFVIQSPAIHEQDIHSSIFAFDSQAVSSSSDSLIKNVLCVAKSDLYLSLKFHSVLKYEPN